MIAKLGDSIRRDGKWHEVQSIREKGNLISIANCEGSTFKNNASEESRELAYIQGYKPDDKCWWVNLFSSTEVKKLEDFP